MLPLGLVLDLGFGEFGRYAMYVVLAAIAYFAFSRFALGESFPDSLGKLPSRATNLLTHLDSLGLSFLKPVATAVAQKQWDQVPTAFNTVFDQLDDKATRGPILDTILERQLERVTGDAEAKAWLLETIGKKLNVTFVNRSLP
jgi:hypothetical protein